MFTELPGFGLGFGWFWLLTFGFFVLVDYGGYWICGLVFAACLWFLVRFC